ncbi:LOW QUALITY PROTEIN: hypothetical protein YC2023_076183 [Brassica napus]
MDLIKTIIDTTLRVPLLVPGVDECIIFFEIPSYPHPYTSSYSPGKGKGGMSNKLLSEVTLDQPACNTLYTSMRELGLTSHYNQLMQLNISYHHHFQAFTILDVSNNLAINQYNDLTHCHTHPTIDLTDSTYKTDSIL